MAFARQQDQEPEAVEVSSFARARAELFGRLLGDGCMLELALADDAWQADLDPAHLETALVHLVRNASEAMAGGGRVTLSTANQALDGDAARRRLGPSATAGDYVEIAVADTGSGIPAEVLGRVFDPFFTTRGAGRAAGLGLSFVWGFAQQSGGRASIESVEGAGTRVSLLLPRRSESAPAVARTEEPQPVARRSAVLVEPDPALRETASALLASLGWDVRTVEDAPAALEALAGAPVDLLFTETAPGGGMDGAMLARRARAERPALRVLFSESRASPAGEAVRPIITKPFGRRELEAALREAMEDERAHG
jgi:CheY-like chemotaxis protein